MADHPAVIVFADYRCTQFCSPILAVTGATLAKSGLDPGRDYRLIVVGFNPSGDRRRRTADGRRADRFRHARRPGDVPADGESSRRATRLTPRSAIVSSMTRRTIASLIPPRSAHRDARRAPLARPDRPFDHRRRREKRADRGEERRRRRVRQPGPVALLRPRRLGRTLCRPSANSARGGRRRDAARRRRGAPVSVARERKRAHGDLVPAASGLDVRAADRRALFHARSQCPARLRSFWSSRSLSFSRSVTGAARPPSAGRCRRSSSTNSRSAGRAPPCSPS